MYKKSFQSSSAVKFFSHFMTNLNYLNNANEKYSKN